VAAVASTAPLPALPEDLSVLVYQSAAGTLAQRREVRPGGSGRRDGHPGGDGPEDHGDGCWVGFDPSSLRVAGGTEAASASSGIRERLESVGGRWRSRALPGGWSVCLDGLAAMVLEGSDGAYASGGAAQRGTEGIARCATPPACWW